jgi:hypothetical protein
MYHLQSLRASSRGRVGGTLGTVRGAVVAAGGWVVDAQSLGGLVLVVRFESDAFSATVLSSALSDAGVVLDPGSQRALSAAPERCAAVGSLTVTLVREGPDERVDIPSVPG